MNQSLSILRFSRLAPLLFCAGCVGKIAEAPNLATGYVAGGIYVTKVGLPADVFGSSSSGRAQVVQLLRNANIDPMGGRIENVEKGTKIQVSQVVTQKSSEVGTIVRVFAVVVSGPYRGATANLYGISTQQTNSDGTMGILMRDPEILELVH